MRRITKLVRLVNTHGNVVIFSSFVRGGNMCQVLNDLFCVFCLTGSRLTSAKQSNKTIQIKEEPEKLKLSRCGHLMIIKDKRQPNVCCVRTQLTKQDS